MTLLRQDGSFFLTDQTGAWRLGHTAGMNGLIKGSNPYTFLNIQETEDWEDGRLIGAGEPPRF